MMPEPSSTVLVPADHPCLEGHFPGRPVVPAVLLLEMALAALQRREGAVRLLGVPHAKFLRPVLPGQPMTFHLDVDGNRASFRCESAGSVVARGELHFTPAAGGGGAA